jgi:hypothetical protein
MIMLLVNDSPIRTRNGGQTWQRLGNFPNASQQYTRTGLYSWTGKTFVVFGRDITAVERQEYPTYVYATTDDGESWVDWVDDLVTMTPRSAVWYDKDFYLSSAGEGIMVRRGAEE